MQTQQIKLSKNPIGYQIFLPIMGAISIVMIILCYVMDTSRPLFSILIGFGFLVKIWPYIKAKKVVYSDNSIIVSNYSKKETIPVDNIDEILILGKGNSMMVQIEFKNDSVYFGKKITYIPKKEISLPRDKEKGIYLAPDMWIRKY